MLILSPLCAPQEPPPQPPGADHRLHQPRLLHLRGSAPRVGRGPRGSPQEAGGRPGRGPEEPEPLRTAGPAGRRGGAVVWPAPLRATEPVPWAPTQPPQSGPPQETQVRRPDQGRGGAGRPLAVRGHSPEPAGAAVPAGRGGQAGAPPAPEPPRPGAAPAALPGHAEAAGPAGSAGRFGPAGSAGSAAAARRPAACQDVATALPSPARPRQPLPCPALLRRCSGGLSLQHSSRSRLRAPFAVAIRNKAPRTERVFAHLALRKGGERKCEPGGEKSGSLCPGAPRRCLPPLPVPWEPCTPLEAALAHGKAVGCHSS